MALEIEHKFLLANEDWRGAVEKSSQFIQGYLSSQPTSSIRVRIADNIAWLNIKSATIGTQRLEFEYEIPVADAEEIIITLCGKQIIKKTRHFLHYEGYLWEIDEFVGENQGLVIAEVELAKVGQNFTKPPWLGAEVTNDLRYYNNNLALNPYKNWFNT